MEFKLKANMIPFMVLAFAMLMALHSIIFTFFMSIDVDWRALLPTSMYIFDNLVWLPLLFFFLYFYLYRTSRIGRTALRNSVIATLIAVIPKIVVLAYLIYASKFETLPVLTNRVADLIAHLVLIFFMVGYWANGFRLREHIHK